MAKINTKEESAANIEEAKRLLGHRVWNTGEIAKHLGYNRRVSLAVTFKKYTGDTLKGYRAEKLRERDVANISHSLLKAMRYLKYTDLSVTKIAEKSGLKNLNSLSAHFCKDIGISPTGYRQNNQTSNRLLAGDRKTPHL